MSRLCLCVNQVALLRNFHRMKEPDPVAVAITAEVAGIDGIVANLKEDRSDLTLRDIEILKQTVNSHLNIAIPLHDEMVKEVVQILPDMVTLLPGTLDGKEQGSLHVVENLEYIEDVVTALRANNVVTSVLVDPNTQQIRAAAKAGVDYVQLNTRKMNQIDDLGTMVDFVENLRAIAMGANKLGLGVSAGIGLDYQNLREVVDISFIEEFNVGRAIIARSVLVGVEKAVHQFKRLGV
jgi:pyridoxine 5-phosphate synthase